ncbi:hypothetical protein LMH87_001862 [Akanthomyces muscarius]|uniref:Uncharacterized protein n=1 Tax=Akanthomyces muscarius TaxID=2231603 RepID=A0A9W8Q8G2_AKAMU|nr:hypothetical protein LMH87_001862 [Akanthomyces muscarius]KAJ4147331.1 hypothetical protein LMH87_001862 [Akanthomyces muscarius]
MCLLFDTLIRHSELDVFYDEATFMTKGLRTPLLHRRFQGGSGQTPLPKKKNLLSSSGEEGAGRAGVARLRPG